MRALILGCGYVGSALALHWRKKGFHLTLTTTSPEKIPQLKLLGDRVLVATGDDEALLFEHLRQCDIVAVTVAAKDRENYQKTYLATAETLCSLLDFCSVRHLIYTGSTGVYGDAKGKWVTEETDLMPETVQAQILADTELCYLDSLPSKVRRTVFRLGEIYGPGREIISRLRLAEGRELPGDGLSYTNRIHREDIVRAIDWVVEHKLEGIYNLVNDFHVFRKEWYERLAAQHGIAPPQWNGKSPSIHGGNKRVDNTKIKSTGFTFLHPICS